MNPGQTAFTVLAAISFCHFLNDMMQALLPAMYPMLKQDFGLDFGRWGSSPSPSSLPRRCCSR
jgi:FSR family fosmidomycin resistance protein-like MFS transporter